MPRTCPRVSASVLEWFLDINKKSKKWWTFRHFFLAWWRFSVVRLFGGCRSTVRVPTQYACNRAGYVDREGEGSTGPSRGEHRLTVYRAHASHENLELACPRWTVNRCSPREGPVEPSPSRNTYPARLHAYWIGTRTLERQPPNSRTTEKNVSKHAKIWKFSNFLFIFPQSEIASCAL